MKLTRQFIFLVAVLLTTSAVTAVASLRALRTLNVALGQVMNQDMQRLVVVTDVRRLFRAMVVLERERILEKEAPRLAEQNRSMGQLRKQLHEKLSAYETLMPDADRAQVATLRQVCDRWIELDDRVFAVSDQHRDADAYALARKHADDPVSWEDLIAKLVAANEDRLRSQVAAAGIAYRRGRGVLLGVALAATLFALIAGTVVLRGIQRIMGDLVALNANLESLVERRTRELRSREESMRLMLDNVSDGFFSVDLDGRVSAERSAAATRWFGNSDGAVPVWDYLGRLDSKATDWIRLGFGQVVDDSLPFEVAVDQMPARLQHGDETFTVEYRPLRSSARLDGLLVVVRDVTKQIESERVEAEQRELTRMVQRIVRDKTGFLDFLAESHEMVGRLLAREPGTDEGLRLVHTLKGNCAVYGILSMSDLCDVIETRCAERGSGVSAEDSRELGRMWEGITSKVNELVGGAGAQGIEIDDQEYATIIRSILHGAPRHDLLEQIVAWRLEPTRVRLQRLADQATGLAQRLGKAPVVVGVEDNGLRLPASQWQRFWSAAVHVVRNAVDHGLEAPGERAQLGKGPSRITLRTQLEERNVVVEIEDDGRGVDWDKIQARGRSLGLPCETHDDLVALMLRDGVSTRDQASSTSGRGVGMAAVREACAMLGGQVLVRSEKGRGSVIRFSFPRSVMVDQTAETILAQPVVLSLEPAPVLRFLRSIAPAGRA